MTPIWTPACRLLAISYQTGTGILTYLADKVAFVAAVSRCPTGSSIVVDSLVLSTAEVTGIVGLVWIPLSL